MFTNVQLFHFNKTSAGNTEDESKCYHADHVQDEMACKVMVENAIIPSTHPFIYIYNYRY